MQGNCEFMTEPGKDIKKRPSPGIQEMGVCEGDYIRTVSLLSLSGKKTLRPPHLRSLRTS